MDSRLNRRRFLACSLTGAATLPLAGVAETFRGIDLRGFKSESTPVGLARSTKHPDTQATMTVKDPSALTALQITDLHFFCTPRKPERDQQTLDDLKRLTDLTEPDLILVTGDLWHENPDGRGEEFMSFAIETVAGLGRPWLYTWGNHDHLGDYVRGHDALAEAPGSLYRGGASGGNYTVQVLDPGGTAVWEFICLNTAQEGLGQEQQEWLKGLQQEREGQERPRGAFGVFHIPIKQYATIWEEKIASGVKLEVVCNEQEDGLSLAGLKALGHVRACVCGHDHVNDYAGTVEGIDLIYGRATGYGGYGARMVPKGAKLYTINAETGQFDWASYVADGTTWKAPPGQQLHHRKETPWGQEPAA